MRSKVRGDFVQVTPVDLHPSKGPQAGEPYWIRGSEVTFVKAHELTGCMVGRKDSGSVWVEETEDEMLEMLCPDLSLVN